MSVNTATWPPHTMYHIIWKCEHFRAQREAVCPKLAAIPPACLHPAVRIGVAPALSARADCAYWGAQIPTVAEDHADYLGARSTAGIS